MASAADVEIPVPLQSPATDQPNAVQHGMPATGASAPSGKSVDLSGAYQTESATSKPQKPATAETTGGIDLSKHYQVEGMPAPTETVSLRCNLLALHCKSVSVT